MLEKKREEGEFRGFDDGEEVKRMNIVRKGGLGEGSFGEVWGGYGREEG